MRVQSTAAVAARLLSTFVACSLQTFWTDATCTCF